MTYNTLYFAYGANMDNNKLINRGIKINWAMRGVLEGYRLVFNKKSKYHTGMGFANIEKVEGTFTQKMEGVLYSVDDFGYIDECEGYPKHYVKQIVWVKVGEKDYRQAITYVANPKMISEDLNPSDRYLYHLIEGAKQHDLSESYIKDLEEI